MKKKKLNEKSYASSNFSCFQTGKKFFRFSSTEVQNLPSTSPSPPQKKTLNV